MVLITTCTIEYYFKLITLNIQLLDSPCYYAQFALQYKWYVEFYFDFSDGVPLDSPGLPTQIERQSF